MQLRCPACGGDLSKRRSTLMPRMELDCPLCKDRIALNLHPVETAVMIASFAAFLFFGALFYVLGRDGFLVAALLSLSVAALLPLLERVWFRDWPRYRKPGSEPG